MKLRSALCMAVVGAFGLAASAVASEGPVVSAEWVEKNLTNPKVRIVEVSVEPGQFERGHIPGAANIAWHTDLVDTVRRDIATKAQFQALVQRLGIDKDTTVVLYGDNNNWFAAWGAWVFDVYGVENVKLLDGGRRKWEADKRAVSSRPVEHKAGTLAVADANTALRARLPDVLAAAEKKSDAKVVDIRGPDEYSGKIFAPEGSKELSIRAGHVPGAINVPWVQAVDPATGLIKPAADLKKLYADKGIDGSKPIIVYCRIGERSSHTWFVLAKVLGYDVRNYDGSWTEYGNSVGVPIENPTKTVWLGK